MISTSETTITKDKSGNKLIVNRAFNAAPAKVWQAWTDSAMLEKWWAPKPWRTETKSMTFKNGGQWLYAMVGPEGEKHWCRVDFQTIEPSKSFTATNSFCDENGNPTDVAPLMHWYTKFEPSGSGTVVTVEITFENAEDLEKIVQMGFKEGFTMAHANLDELLAGN